MPPPPRPNRRRGGPPPQGRTGQKPVKKPGAAPRQRDRREPENPQDRTKGWGGVARRGARRLDEAKPGSAAAAFRDAAQKAEEERERKRPRAERDSEQWIDAGPVRNEASAAVARGAKKPPPVRRDRRKKLPDEVGREVAKAAGPAWAGRVTDRLQDAAKAYEAERFRDAKRILEALLERAPSAIAVRELLGLTYYRLGKWCDAIRELGAVELLTGSVDHHPVIADANRAMGRLDEVERLWDELRRAGAGVDVVIEGRIVMAGALADAGRVPDAVKLLEQGPVEVRKPQEHHLRLWYALAALYERAGDVPRARALFGRLVATAPDFADGIDRLESLGG